ncbi:phospholipid carrier-dependent glycosyltransferase [Novosphingobium sp. SG720]|uniref:phospholipid carrier-dependent glycosyltransferase n=1 Tax=Novosphingobium sp. SG720 TaxID=2586998 RepID=UPI0017C6C855|nr:phospholipid carrier-dependent glycosyltransferase [Novosphingobium sp. SG720]NKJ43934.1 hypothetical protein [Novosphingobium sp. SG720]
MDRARTIALVAVLGVAAALLLPRLGAVRAPIWDEAYYLPAIARLHEGRIQFASHPPLGLMLPAGGDWLAGGNAQAEWRIIAATRSARAEMMPDPFDYAGPRLASAGGAVLAAGLLFLLLAALTGHTGLSLALALVFAGDPAIVAQARAAQLDGLQLPLFLGALLCLVRGLAPGASAGWSAGFGGLLMAAALVRANALALAPLGLFLAFCPKQSLGMAGARLVASVTAALAVLALTLATMLAIAPLPPDKGTPAGAIDARHASITYAMLPAPRAMITYGTDYAAFMRDDLAGMARRDANATHPWQWLLGMGATTYRWDARGNSLRAIGVVPNLPGWIMALAGVILALGNLLARRAAPATVVLLCGWVLAMGSLVWLDGQRVMYTYHYFLPLVVGHALLAAAWHERGWPARRLYPAVPIALAYGLAAMPMALALPVPREYCQVFLPDCGPAPQPSMRP